MHVCALTSQERIGLAKYLCIIDRHVGKLHLSIIVIQVMNSGNNYKNDNKNNSTPNINSKVASNYSTRTIEIKAMTCEDFSQII